MIPMHPNAALIERFYLAFQQRDGAAMASCYSPDARFEDPAFGELRGAEIGAMWTMLCERAKDFSLEYSDIEADELTGRAHWEARYTFSASGRSVHNRISASFRFDNGLIADHRDRFDMWRWTSQALGPIGLLLGWSPLLKAKVRKQARAGLTAWIARQAS
jgi:ketosteroid isomerase-like protein